MANTVLIAASPYDAEFICRTVQDAGYEPVVWDGRAGLLELADRSESAALVLSRRLGALCCVEVLAGLRQGEREGSRLPVLLISETRSEPATLADAVRLGADQLLLRPIEPLLLLSKLDAMVAQTARVVTGNATSDPRERSFPRGTLPVPTTVARESHGSADRAPTLTGLAPTRISPAEFRAQVRARENVVREGSYFAVLGLPPGAGASQVEAAYQARREELDPLNVAERVDDLADTLAQIHAVLEEAYLILRDDASRDAYRAAL